MISVAAPPLLIDDGPECPECGSRRWAVEIRAVDSIDDGDRWEVVLQVVQIVCRICDLSVPIEDDDSASDSMHWLPDPSDPPSSDLP